jgi:hypothetical protein
MDVQTAPPAAPPAAPSTAAPADRLGAEVRESALLLVLSLAVTAGISVGAQALLALAG